MERIGKEMALNDMDSRRKDCDITLKPSDKNELLESPMVCASVGSEWRESSSHNYTDRKGEGCNNDLSQCVVSYGRSEPPGASLCTLPDAAIVTEELTVENHRKPNSGLVRNSIQLQPQHDYGHAVSHLEKEQIWLKVREQFVKDKQRLNASTSRKSSSIPDQISPFLWAVDNKTGLTNTFLNESARLKTLSTSGFSQLLLKKSLKGKGTIGATVRPSNEKEDRATKVASAAALLKSSAENDMLPSNCVGELDPNSAQDGITVREWLKPGSCKRDKLESLNLFRQVVELVDFAHSQGVALQNLQPSFLKIMPSKKVMYTGSFSKRELKFTAAKDFNKKRPLEMDMDDYSGEKQQKLSEDMRILRQQHLLTSGYSRPKTLTEDTRTYMNLNCKPSRPGLQGRNHFLYHISAPLTSDQKSISETAQLEDKWYVCPKDSNEKLSSFESNIYCLGVLLFELLCSCESFEMRSALMLDLQHRILPPSFLSETPKEAGFCLWLLHPEPTCRPSTREILKTELISGSQKLKLGDSSTIADDDDGAEQELLLQFLTSLEEQKQKHASKLDKVIECLEEDIKEVERMSLVRTSSISSQVIRSERKPVSTANEVKFSRNINVLEDAYFSIRSQIRLADNAGPTRSDKDLLKHQDNRFDVENEKTNPDINKKSNDHLGAFFDGLCKFARYSKLEVCGTLRNGDLLNSANVICTLSFDRDEEYIATAGVSKRIKIFDFGAILNDSIDIHYPAIEMSNRSKISCVCWNGYIKNYLASTDYDGVVKIWDASIGQGISQFTEHMKRAWSIDFSLADPTIFASGSDDCSVKLWNINEKSSVGTIFSPANVCCVQFSTFSTNMLAFGSADYKVYCYDLRHTRVPWCILSGHDKAVSYVKFSDCETIVSASTDNTLKLWDLNKTSSNGLSQNACRLTFKGHTNEKNFVGLSVLDGYIACGSETNEVYAYYKSFPMPITSHKFGSMDPISGQETGDDTGLFVSSVCWRRKSNMIVAANSSGCVKLLQMV